MARYRKNYIDLIAIITVLITIGVFLVKFLINVHKFGCWKEFLLSTLLFFLINILGYNLGVYAGDKMFFLILVGAFIWYCVYWYKKLSYADTHLNSEFWVEREWWWTLDGWQFEQEVARVFRLHGYKAKVTKGSGDGGVDIILKKDGEILIVQCKHYQSPLGPEPVRALWGCKDDFNADKVVMVASSGLTQSSVEFVNNKQNYLVLNLDDIIKMVQLAPSPDEKIICQK